MIITCAACGGTGLINGIACSRCSGDGKIDLLSDDMKKVGTSQDAAIRGQVWSTILANQQTIIDKCNAIFEKVEPLSKCKHMD